MQILLEWLLTTEQALPECTIVEMGAGVGLTSIGLAKAGCGSVIATDFEAATIKNLKQNCHTNKVQVDAAFLNVSCRNMIVLQNYTIHTRDNMSVRQKRSSCKGTLCE